MAPATKTFRKDNKWIEKKAATKVVVCRCGMKYIKTRPRQATCIPCLYGKGLR